MFKDDGGCAPELEPFDAHTHTVGASQQANAASPPLYTAHFSVYSPPYWQHNLFQNVFSSGSFACCCSYGFCAGDAWS